MLKFIAAEIVEVLRESNILDEIEVWEVEQTLVNEDLEGVTLGW